MKIDKICLLREGDTVICNGKEKHIKERALNDTIKVGNSYRYYSEIQTVDEFKNKAKHSNYNLYTFKD